MNNSMEHAKEISLIREEQGRLGQTVKDLANTVAALAESVTGQAKAISSLTTDVQSLASGMKGREGRVDLKLLITILTFVGSIVLVLAGMFIMPLQTKTELMFNAQDQRTTAMRTTLDTLVDHQRRQDIDSARQFEHTQGQDAQIGELWGDMLARLKEEAKAGREAMREAAKP